MPAPMSSRRWQMAGPCVMHAAFLGHPAVLRQLLLRGAKPDAAFADGRTARLIAAELRHVAEAQALVQGGADIDAADVDGCTAHIAGVQASLEGGANANAATAAGTTALKLAAQFGHVPVIQALVAAGAEVDAAAPHGSTALTWAARDGQTAAVQVLLVEGADVHARMANGATALTLGGRGGHVAVVLALLGADAHAAAAKPNAALADGLTALMRRCAMGPRGGRENPAASRRARGGGRGAWLHRADARGQVWTYVGGVGIGRRRRKCRPDLAGWPQRVDAGAQSRSFGVGASRLGACAGKCGSSAAWG